MLYQEETQKALRNFPITGRPFSLRLAKNIALIKMLAAETNDELDTLDAQIASVIKQAADEIIRGKRDNEIVVDEFQGGAGTSMNMNINEIIATRATEMLGSKVHALDHVNLSQSTNDVVPTAAKISCLQFLDKLTKAYENYWQETKIKAAEFIKISKIARTHLQDAVPITLGQEFEAHASAIAADIKRLERTRTALLSVNIGGTAVGTGVNASRKYSVAMINKLKQQTGYQFRLDSDLIYSTQYLDSFVETSAMLTVLATNIIKFMNDLRLLASGPKAGIAEIHFEALQKGSTIMPGKVNPVMAELLDQIAFQIIGNNQTIIMAAQAGQLELNVMLPVVVKNLFESLEILTNGIYQFTELGLKHLIADEGHCQELLEKSHAKSASLLPKIGYDKAQEAVEQAMKFDKKLDDALNG